MPLKRVGDCLGTLQRRVQRAPPAGCSPGIVPIEPNFASASQVDEGRQSQCHIFLIVVAIMSLLSLPTPSRSVSTRRCCGPCRELGRAAAAEEQRWAGLAARTAKGHTDTSTRQEEQSRSGDSDHIQPGDQWAHRDVPEVKAGSATARHKHRTAHPKWALRTRAALGQASQWNWGGPSWLLPALWQTAPLTAL